MEMSLNIISETLKYLQVYINEKGEAPPDFNEYILWLNEQLFEQEAILIEDHGDTLDIELTFLMVVQNKYYKQYCKQALANSELNTPDSYSFLYHLSLVESYRKMELINIHLLEAPSGIEVIKRLLKKEMIEEFDDIDDKRAKRIRITNRGYEEIEKLAPRMQEVYSKMTAKMSPNEKMHVVAFLRKLNTYHNMHILKK